MVKTICTQIKLICNSEKVIGAGFRKFSIFNYYSLTNMKRPSDQLFAKTPSQMRESKFDLKLKKLTKGKKEKSLRKIAPITKPSTHVRLADRSHLGCLPEIASPKIYSTSMGFGLRKAQGEGV